LLLDVSRKRVGPRPYASHTELFIAGSIPMLDVILVAAAVGFFALSVGYTIACDRL
jgi:hypothetical protein